MGFGSWIKDKVDDAGDAIEGAVDSGEKLLGEGVEKVSHVAEDGLDAVGAHGAADWVRSHGDSLADHLGADVDEMQLGETDDPKQLVHGDVDKIHDDISHLTDLAKSCGEVADGLAGIEVGDWRGEGGDAFDATWSKTPTDWRHAEDACSKASSALSSYVSTLKWAQDQAAEAIRQYNDAKTQLKQAEDAYNSKVDSYNQAVDAHNAGSTAPLPDKPGDFHDPGPALFDAAQDTLDAARKQRDQAAEDAASAIDAATEMAPAKPDFTDRMGADLSDLQNMYAYNSAHFLGGVMKGTGELVKFVRATNITDPYNLTHPAEYLSSMNQMAAGLLDTAVHPGQLVHSIVGAGWTTDPAEALGKLVPQIALTVATDGAGAAEGVAERGVIGVGEDAAERGAIGAGEDAAGLGERGAEGAADDAGGVADDAGQTAHDGVPDEAKQGCGDPVDVATGAVFLEQTDLSLPGALPLVISRKHSSQWDYGLWFGRSWASTFDERIDLSEDGEHVVAVRSDATASVYPHPTVETATEPVAGGRTRLVRDEVGGYTLTDLETGTERRYLRPHEGRAYLAAITIASGHRIAILRDPYGVPVEIRHTGGYRVLVDTSGLRVTGLTVVADDGSDPVRIAGYGYDAAGNLNQVTNASGQPLRFTYDEHGRLVQWADRNGTEYRYGYDARGRCIDQAGTGGVMANRFTYSDLGPDLNEMLVSDSAGHETRYLVNDLFQIVSVTDPLGAETRSSWDEHNRLLAQTDPLGRTTRYAYNDDGTLAAVTRPDGTQHTFAYTVSGGRPQPVQVTLPDGTTWRFGYDEHGNRTSLTDPAGVTTRYGYDEHGHLVTVTDALGNTRTIANNPAGLPIAITEADGTTTHLERDPLGRVTTITDPLGHQTLLAWTSDSRLASRTLPDGTTETWSYDAEGNPIEHTDPAGRVIRTTYTHFDQPAQVTAPDGTTTSYTYDPELRLRGVTNPQGATWIYDYDPAGRLVAETDYNGRTLRYAYDRAGQLVSRTNGAGETITYTHDTLGNLTSQNAAGVVTTFEHDPLGRMTRATSPEVDLVIERDLLGRVVAETVNGHALSSTYDALGRRTSRVTPTGVETTWSYATSNLPETIAHGGHAIGFHRDLAGRETRRDLAAATLDQTWDPVGNLTMQTLATAPAGPPISSIASRLGGAPTNPGDDGPRLLQQRSYTYAAGNRLIGIDDHLTGARRFELDLADRITSVTGPDWTEIYAYDPMGNITRAATGTPGENDAERRQYRGTLLTRSGLNTYAYDAQGRLTRKTTTRLSAKPETWLYHWDPEDRLTHVRTPDGTTWHYLYDPLGRRIAKQRLAPDGTVAEETLFTWDGTTLAEESSTVGARTWAHDGLRPLAQLETQAMNQDEVDARFYAIITDLVGSPTELVDDSGALAWHARRTLWGAPGTPGDDPIPLRFAGQYEDRETGLNYNFRRYYDPDTGRYVSQDPLGLAPAPNPSTYVSNPTVLADPSGLAPCDPVDVLDPRDRQHILDGDGPGSGGHRWPGEPGKTPYPQSWSDDQIIHNVGDIVTDPHTQWHVQTGSGGAYTNSGNPAVWRAWEVRDGVRIRVAYEPATGRVRTAFPDSGPTSGALVP